MAIVKSHDVARFELWLHGRHSTVGLPVESHLEVLEEACASCEYGHDVPCREILMAANTSAFCSHPGCSGLLQGAYMASELKSMPGWPDLDAAMQDFVGSRHPREEGEARG